MIRLSFWKEGEKSREDGEGEKEWGVGEVFLPFYSAKFSPKAGLDIQRRINDLNIVLDNGGTAISKKPKHCFS